MDLPILQIFTTHMAMDAISLLPQPCPLTLPPVHRRKKSSWGGGEFEYNIEIQAKQQVMLDIITNRSTDILPAVKKDTGPVYKLSTKIL
jgi:hypothetical protein